MNVYKIVNEVFEFRGVAFDQAAFVENRNLIADIAIADLFFDNNISLRNRIFQNSRKYGFLLKGSKIIFNIYSTKIQKSLYNRNNYHCPNCKSGVR